jgi:LPXTG-motif cell wall-anchored protein
MRPSPITGIAIAAFFTVTSSAFAQTAPAQTPAQTKNRDTAAPQTFTGCLMTERDYRRAHNLGEGTVGGAGLGDEYVLVDVKVSPAKSAAATAPASGASVSATATTSSTTCADKGTAYRLTGSGEEQLKTLAGRHVEIQGRFKDPTDAREGEKLPNEVELISFREAPAPAAVTEPVAPPPTTPAPPPAPPTAAPPRAQTAPPTSPTLEPPAAQAATPTTAAQRELPRTASSTALLALIGVVALSSGIALFVVRRRVL